MKIVGRITFFVSHYRFFGKYTLLTDLPTIARDKMFVARLKILFTWKPCVKTYIAPKQKYSENIQAYF